MCSAQIKFIILSGKKATTDDNEKSFVSFRSFFLDLITKKIVLDWCLAVFVVVDDVFVLFVLAFCLYNFSFFYHYFYLPLSVGRKHSFISAPNHFLSIFYYKLHETWPTLISTHANACLIELKFFEIKVKVWEEGKKRKNKILMMIIPERM